MVQGEKDRNLMSMAGGRTNDASARKAGFEAIKKMDNEKKDSKNSAYGSWGPVFQNKNTFAQMHFS